MIALLKTLHIAGLVVWCAGLLALPLLLGLYRSIMVHPAPADVLHNYTRFRRLTHLTYTAVATPAAIVAIAAGTGLIFAAQVFEIWLLLKLACVAGMVLAHAWLGHLIVQSGERSLAWRMPRPGMSLVLAVPCMLGVLWLVLVKPELTEGVQALPDWLVAPHGITLGELMARVLEWLGLGVPAMPVQEPVP